MCSGVSKVNELEGEVMIAEGRIFEADFGDDVFTSKDKVYNINMGTAG